MSDDIIRVEKPWGYELHWAKTDRYVGKLIHVNKGHALSLQYHNQKDETIFLWSGRLLFGSMLGGWGLFNFVEGIDPVNPQSLGKYQRKFSDLSLEGFAVQIGFMFSVSPQASKRCGCLRARG